MSLKLINSQDLRKSESKCILNAYIYRTLLECNVIVLYCNVM